MEILAGTGDRDDPDDVMMPEMDGYAAPPPSGRARVPTAIIAVTARPWTATEKSLAGGASD